MIALAVGGLAACGGSSGTGTPSTTKAAPPPTQALKLSGRPYPAGIPRREPRLDDYYVSLRKCTYAATKGNAAAEKSCQCEIDRMHATFASAHDFGVFVGLLRAGDAAAKRTLERVHKQCS